MLPLLMLNMKIEKCVRLLEVQVEWNMVYREQPRTVAMDAISSMLISFSFSYSVLLYLPYNSQRSKPAL